MYRLLTKAGCYIERNGAKHDLWVNPKTGRTSLVGRHPTMEIPKGTEISIRRKLLE